MNSRYFEDELWELIEREWQNVVLSHPHRIVMPTDQEEDFLACYGWRVTSSDGTSYLLTLCSLDWDTMPDGQRAIKVELTISGGRLEVYSRVLSKYDVIPAQLNGENDAFISDQYRELARELIARHGPLIRVEYIRPPPGAKFVFERKTLGEHEMVARSGLSLQGGSGRYAWPFLDEVGFHTSREAAQERHPGSILKLHDGRVVISYPYREAQSAATLSQELPTHDPQPERAAGTEPATRKRWKFWR